MVSKTKKNADTRHALLKSASLLAAAAAAMTATPALAQDAEEEEAIVVTGSRIARSDATSSLPLTVVDQEAIQNAGVIGIGEILRQDPAISGGGFGQSNILSGGGAQTIDLRNLGVNRTLVLINGQRYSLFLDALQNEGQDLGMLPAGMIERVEILRDGASTAYGADAVAGVVNFILKDDFDGLDVSALYSVPEGGFEGEQMRASFTVGASSERGSVVAAMEYSERDNINQFARGGFLSTPFGAINATPFAGVGSGIGGPQIRTTPGNALIECYGVNGGSLGAGPCARYNYAMDQDIVAAQETFSVSLNATYEITDNIEWHGAAIVGDRFSEFGLAANPISANSPTGPYAAGIVVPTSAANNYGVPYSFTWRPTTYGNRQQTVTGSQMWLSTGFSGTVGDEYNWDVTATRSEVRGNVRVAVVPNVVRLARLLDPTACNADPLCAGVGPIANHEAFWDNSVRLTPGQQNYAFYTQNSDNRFVTDNVQGSISGPLFELPAGALSFAAGIEYRSEYGESIPDSQTAGGEGVANATTALEGDFDVFEVFAELDIPLLADMPLAHELTLNLQARHSDFSNFGGADTWKVGLVYAPIEDLRIRANMGTSFRAPNVQELFGQGVQSFNTITDPCTTGTPGSGTSSGAYLDTASAATCAALGVPLTYVQPAAQLRNFAGGNVNLQPETGETWTVGAVYQPSFFTPLTLTVDFWHLEVESAIVSQGLQAPFTNCYQLSPLSAFNPGGACFQFGQRTPSGVPSALSRILINGAGASETQGIDASAILRFENVGPGDLRLGARTTYTEDANGPLFLGAGINAVGLLDGLGGTGFPEWRSTFDADYDVGNWRLSWQTRYTSEMHDPNCRYPIGSTTGVGGTAIFAGNANCGTVVANQHTNAFNYNGTDEYFIHDARIRYAQDNYAITLGINNVADEYPPLAFNTGNNTYPALYDVIGRTFFIAASTRF